MQIINLTKGHYYLCSTEDMLLKAVRKPFFHILGHELYHYCHCLRRNKGGITPCFSEHDHDLLFSIMEQIPIFLVDQSLCRKSFRIGFIGHSQEITVPDDGYIAESVDIDELYKDLENGICEDVTNNDEVDPEPDFPDYNRERRPSCNQGPKKHWSVFDLLGVYVRQYPAFRTNDMTESWPQIYIWVDKVSSIAGDNHNHFDALLTQVIGHELMHAFMDIDLLGCDHLRSYRIKQSLYTLKEECLANALSLLMLKSCLDKDQWKFVTDFVKTQPFAYKLGLDYAKAGEMTVMEALNSWLEIKGTGKLNKDALDYWLHYIFEKKSYDRQQLELYEIGLVSSKGRVFRYKSKMYSDNDVAVKVIKDYIKTKKCKLTRQDLKDAFPDGLNEYHNVFIDYPELSRFAPKKGSGWADVVEKNMINCIDGDLAICNYWHPNSMPAFVENAKRLGFDIEMFGW